MAETLFIAPDGWSTDRIRLRRWLPGDGPLLTEAVDGSFEHLRRWIPWAQPEQTEAESESTARRFRAQWLLAENFVMPILSPDGRRVLGGTGFHVRQGPLAGGAVEVGMWIRVDEAGQGLGSHALGALVAWAWAEWPWRRLVWKCDVDNGPSRRVAEKQGFALEGILRQDGFTPEGVLRDSCIYALLRP